MVMNREHRQALDDWFDVATAAIHALSSGAELYWSAALDDIEPSWLGTAAPSTAVQRLRALRTHPCPQNRRLGCPGLPKMDGEVQYYTRDGRLASEPAGLLSLTPYDTATEKVTREDVLHLVAFRMREAKAKAEQVSTCRAQDRYGMSAVRQFESLVYDLQTLVQRQENRRQQEIADLHCQAGHYVAALIRAFQLTEGASAAASATVPPRGEPPPEGGREVGPRQEAGRASEETTVSGSSGSPATSPDPSPMVLDEPLPSNPPTHRASSPSNITSTVPRRLSPPSRTMAKNGGAANAPNSPALPPHAEPALQPLESSFCGAAAVAATPSTTRVAVEQMLQHSHSSNGGVSPGRVASPARVMSRDGDKACYEAVAQDDADLVRQRAAEMRELRRTHEQQLARERVRPPVVPESVGLENPVGAHNCFLNVVLQSLWHLGDFRGRVEELPQHQCRPNCIFCAIRNLFTQYKFGSYAHMPPKDVREVVSRIFSQEQRFQVDQMDDAAEMLDAILQQLHLETTSSEPHAPCQPPCLPHAVFAAEIIERRQRCPTCRDPGEHFNSYVTNLHYFPASLLGRSGRLEARMRAHLESDVRTCKHCNQWDTKSAVALPIHKHMCNLPPIFACVLAWAGEQSTREVLQGVTGGIGETLQLGDVFRLVAEGDSQHPHVLRGMICFYGRHYMAYFWNRTHHQWVFIDDSNIRPVGDWSTVCHNIIDGRHMPLVLFYVHGDGPHQPAAPKSPASPAPTAPGLAAATHISGAAARPGSDVLARSHS
eukprot:EG_transcript_3564